MAPHSSTLAWKIPWMEEPSRLQSMGSLRVGHDWVTSLSLFTFMHWRRKWQATPVFLPGESQGRGSLWAAVSGVAQSRTRLKRLISNLAAAVMPEPESDFAFNLDIDFLGPPRWELIRKKKSVSRDGWERRKKQDSPFFLGLKFSEASGQQVTPKLAWF